MASERILWEDRVPRGTKLNIRPPVPRVRSGLPRPSLFRALSFLIFAVLLILAFLVLRPISLALRQRMEFLRDELLSRGEELIGRRIEYESLEPSFLGGVDVRSLTVSGNGSQPLFSASRFRLSWSLWDLLRKEGPGIRGLRIDGPELYIDPPLDRDLPELLARIKELAASGGEGISLNVFSFRIRNGNFRVEGLGALSGVDMDAEIRNGRIEAQGDWDAELRLGERSFTALAALVSPDVSPPAVLTRFLDGPPLNISTGGRFRLSGETDLSEGRAFLSLPFINEDRFRVAGLELNMELKDRVLSLNTEGPGMAAPFNIALDYGIDTGDITARLNCRNYSPADTLRFLGPWKDHNRFLALRATGEAALSYSSAGILDYRADLSGRIPPNLPLANSGFNVKLGGSGDRVNVDRLDLSLARDQGAGGALSFRGRIDAGSFDVNGTLGIADLSLTGNGGIDTLLTIRSRGKDVTISADKVKIGEAEFTALELDLIRESRGLGFSAEVLRSYGKGASDETPDKTLAGVPVAGISGPARPESGDGPRGEALPGETFGETGEALPAGRAFETPAAIRLSGTLDYAPLYLETRLTLDSCSVGDAGEFIRSLAAEFELPPGFPPQIPRLGESILQNTQVTTEVFVSTDFEHILYNAPRLVISYSGDEELLALFSLSGTDRRFTVDGGQILWNGGDVQITGHSDFSDADNISFALNAAYRDINYSLEGALLARRSLSLRGSYGLYGSFDSMGDGLFSGQLRGENIPVHIDERIGRVSFDLTMGYQSSESWYVELSGLELADFAAAGPGLEPGGLLTLSVRVDQNQISLRNMYFSDSLGVLRGGGAFIPVANGEYQGNFSIFDDDRRESYTVDLSWVPGGRRSDALPILGDLSWSLNLWEFLNPDSGADSRDASPEFPARAAGSPRLKLRVSGVGMRLARFFRRLPSVRVDGILDLEWESIKQFNAGLNIYSLGVAGGGQEIIAGGQAYIDGRGLRAENLRLSMGGIETLVPRFRLSLDESRMEGGGRIQGRLSGRELGLDFSLDSQFAPMDSWLDYAAALKDLRGAIELENITAGGVSRNETFKFTFTRQGQGMVFSGGPDDMIFFNIKQDGAFIAAFADPFPLRGTFMGTLGFGGIDARGEGVSLNLPVLWQFVPNRDMFNISSGHAVGSLQIRGPLENPEFYGRVHGENLRMQIPRFLMEDIIPVDMSLVFDGDEIRFSDTVASCGKKGMGVVNGQFLLEKWKPVAFSVNVTVGRDRPLPFKFDIGGVLARGATSGVLNIAMADNVVKVSGDLIAQETEISLNAAEIAASQRGEGWDDLDMPVITDLVVTAGRKVEFLWPVREFPVLQAYADLGTKVNIFVNTMDRSFAFTGDVKLRSGEVFYFERSFYIRNGMLVFREDQDHFDPRITVRAEARDRASNGPVTISMVVDNAPLQSFTPRFESSPALSQTEILSLLGQNFVGAAGEDGSVPLPFLSSSADLLAQSQVMRRVQGALRDLLHLDMFSVRTQFIQRAAIGFMGIQDQPVDRIGWVGNYFDNTSVFIGKYIGSEMFAQAMLSLRYNENKQTFGGYTLEPDFGIELRSPLGNIRWNLVPTHPENWYLDDCSFTISWNFSF